MIKNSMLLDNVDFSLDNYDNYENEFNVLKIISNNFEVGFGDLLSFNGDSSFNIESDSMFLKSFKFE